MPLFKSDFLTSIFGRSSPKDLSSKVFLEVASAFEDAFSP